MADFDYTWFDDWLLGDLKVICDCGETFYVSDVYDSREAEPFRCPKCKEQYRVRTKMWIEQVLKWKCSPCSTSYTEKAAAIEEFSCKKCGGKLSKEPG
jgi:transcription initiation factor IIE alpha subunit